MRYELNKERPAVLKPCKTSGDAAARRALFSRGRWCRVSWESERKCCWVKK